MYKDIVEAYNILSDPKKRKIYDEGGHPDDPNSAFHTQNQSDTFDEIVKQASSNYQQNEAKDFKDEKPKNEKNNRNNPGYKGKTTHSKGKKPRHYDNRYK
jgi:DnaJ-class molecular chaperone